MLALVDMAMGNLQSVLEAFQRVGGKVTVTTRVEDVEQADAVILPGVGAFGDGMTSLRRNRLVEPLCRHVRDKKKPLLGICLGMQLLAEEGEEHGNHKGLGLIWGRVMKLKPSEKNCRVPNMGWCDVHVNNPKGSFFSTFVDGDAFYFAHSYHMECGNPEDVAATIQYGGQRLTAAVERGNLFGVQFHPEKSQDAGLNVLAAFVNRLRLTDGLK